MGLLGAYPLDSLGFPQGLLWLGPGHPGFSRFLMICHWKSLGRPNPKNSAFSPGGAGKLVKPRETKKALGTGQGGLGPLSFIKFQLIPVKTIENPVEFLGLGLPNVFPSAGSFLDWVSQHNNCKTQFLKMHFRKQTHARQGPEPTARAKEQGQRPGSRAKGQHQGQRLPTHRPKTKAKDAHGRARTTTRWVAKHGQAWPRQCQCMDDDMEKKKGLGLGTT